MLKVGDQIETWFSGRDDGLSTILEIRPYTGLYKSWFSHVVRATAPRTVRGWIEMSVKDTDERRSPPSVRDLCDPAYTLDDLLPRRAG